MDDIASQEQAVLVLKKALQSDNVMHILFHVILVLTSFINISCLIYSFMDLPVLVKPQQF